MRLLLVEDNPDLADAIIRRMRRSGHAVDWQADGLAAASVLRYQSFDLVVLAQARWPARAGRHARAR